MWSVCRLNSKEMLFGDDELAYFVYPLFWQAPSR
jgi:hypothetical protein